jgi:hypothetical protein
VDSSVLNRPSRWAIDRFGQHLAAELWLLVPRAIEAAVHRALDAHEASRMQTDHAFGAGWSLPYDELVNHLGSIDGAQLVDPPRAFYQLVMVGGHVLLPWRYADGSGVSVEDSRTVRRLGVLGRELLRRFGPPPRWREEPLPLFDDMTEQREADLVTSALDMVEPPPRVLIVGFASNSTQGLLHLCWGEAAVAEGGNLHWHYHEDLPLPAVPYVPRQRRNPD